MDTSLKRVRRLQSGNYFCKTNGNASQGEPCQEALSAVSSINLERTAKGHPVNITKEQSSRGSYNCHPQKAALDS